MTLVLNLNIVHIRCIKYDMLFDISLPCFSYKVALIQYTIVFMNLFVYIHLYKFLHTPYMYVYVMCMYVCFLCK